MGIFRRFISAIPLSVSHQLIHSFSNPWLLNLSVRLFSVTARTVCSLAPFGSRASIPASPRPPHPVGRRGARSPLPRSGRHRARPAPHREKRFRGNAAQGAGQPVPSSRYRPWSAKYPQSRFRPGSLRAAAPRRRAGGAHLGLDDQAGILGVQHDTMSTSQAAIPSRRIVEAFRVGEGVRLPRQQHQTVAYRLHTKNL